MTPSDMIQFLDQLLDVLNQHGVKISIEVAHREVKTSFQD